MSGQIVTEEFLYCHMEGVELHMLDALPAESELAYPFSKAFERKMKRLIKQEKRSPRMNRFLRYAKKAVAIFLVMLSAAFITTMSVEAYRIQFFNLITTVWDKFTSVILGSEETVGNFVLEPSQPLYLPDGYEEFEKISSQYEQYIYYRNAANEELHYSQCLSTQGERILNTEGTSVTSVLIGEQMVYVFSNHGANQIYWYDEYSNYAIIGTPESSELLKMAKSVILKG